VRNLAAILRRRRTTVGAWGGVNIAVLTLVEDGLEEDPPFYSLDTTKAGTLRIDFHSVSSPSPSPGAGDIGSLTQSVTAGMNILTIDLSAYPSETGFLHFSQGASNVLVSQEITTPAGSNAFSLRTDNSFIFRTDGSKIVRAA
jgi:hypothetical protein